MNNLLIALLTTVAITAQVPTNPDVKPVLNEIQRIRTQVAEERKSGKPVTRDELDTRLSEAATRAVVGVDASRFTAEQAEEWLPVFQLAHRTTDVGTLAHRAASYFVFKAWEAQQDELTALVEQGKGEEAVNVLRYAAATQVNMLAQLAEYVHSEMTAKFIRTNPKVLFDAYDVLLCRMDPSNLTSKADRSWADICYVNVMAQRCDLLFALGRRAEALAGLANLRSRFASSRSINAYGGTTVMAIDRMEESWGMVKRRAPELTVDRTIGKFGGVSALRGQVVVLDFFAHWCGPCKRAFPELRDFDARYRQRGLALVGVTSYYGYYGAEQGLTRDQEFSKMGRFVRDMNLTWPIAFDPKKSYEKSYGVSEIPQIVLIDRKGMVRMVQFGYEPAKRADIEAELKKLLDEKA